jgi:hypothetical protein
MFLCIHIYTLIIAFPGGLLKVFLTLILPVAAEVYWIARLWSQTGTFLNLLTMMSMTCVALAGLALFFAITSRESA